MKFEYLKRQTILAKKKKKSDDDSFYYWWNLMPSLNLSNSSYQLKFDFAKTSSLLFLINKTMLFNFSKPAKMLNFTIQDELLINNSAYIFDTYYYYRFSTFINFFNRRRVDVPMCFLGVRSLRRFSFELLLTKFSNLLMRAGKKEKIFALINKTFQMFLLAEHSKQLKIIKQTDWLHIFFINNVIFFKKFNINFAFKKKYLQGYYNSFYRRFVKYNYTDYQIKDFLLKTMFIIQPLFHFSVYNIDKKVKKFMKEKENYVFVWKYIPLYKRKILTLRLVTKNIKFDNGFTFEARFFNSLNTFTNKPQNSFVWKINHFSHNFVFKNLQKTLLSNLKSSSK